MIKLTREFDDLDLRQVHLKVTPAEIDAARGKVEQKTLQALELAHERILDHHKRQLPKNDLYRDRLGVELRTRTNSGSASASLYVPGSTASYPSSVLMKRRAGQGRRRAAHPCAWWCPAPERARSTRWCWWQPSLTASARSIAYTPSRRSPLWLTARSIPPVTKIVGQGNAYVADAKRQVLGQVGINMVASPSEVVAVTNKDNDPAWIAS